MNKSKTIPKGYKQTKIGTLPVEWEVVRTSKLFKVTSGGTPKRDISEYWHNGTIPWVTTSIVNYKEIIDASEYITEKGLEESSAKLFPKGTLLMAMYGQGKTRGQVALLGREASTNQACAAFMPKSDRSSTEFLFYFFSLKYNWLRNLSNDGGQKNLSGGLLKSIQIPLPPLPQQQKIAKILATWDQAIQTQTQLINAKKEQKRGLMQRLLTGEVQLSAFKEDWVLKNLDYYFDERLERNREDLPLLSIGQDGVYPQGQSNKRDISNSDKSKYKRILPDDIGYNTMRMWQGRSALSTLEGIVSPAYTILKPKETATVNYFKYLFQSPEMIHKFYNYSQGLVSDTWQCKFKDFIKVKALVPSTVEEQTAIANILTTADRELTLLEAQLTELKEQKRGLMQRLLTGQVRVNVATA